MFPSLGGQELFIILFLALLIFGAKRLPEVGARLGKGIKAFKEALKSADVKEELGLLTRKASNRQGHLRKIKAPEEYKKFIKKAIKELKAEGEKQTYKNIQQKAFELYQKKVNKTSIVERYYGFLKITDKDKDFVRKIAEDEGLYYEGLGNDWAERALS